MADLDASLKKEFASESFDLVVFADSGRNRWAFEEAECNYEAAIKQFIVTKPDQETKKTYKIIITQTHWKWLRLIIRPNWISLWRSTLRSCRYIRSWKTLGHASAAL